MFIDPARPEQPVRMLGLRPIGPLAGTLRARKKTFGRIELRPGQWMFDLDVTDVRPSLLGDDLLDVTVKGGMHHPAPLSAKPIWDMWVAGGPDTRNLWTPLDTAKRNEWMRAALFMRQPGDDHEPGRTYHLDGRHVTDTPGFFCALGEAVNGPGGYFGWNADAVIDCCRGHWGARTPFTLVWHDWQVAGRHLPVEPTRYRRIDWVELLRDGGVTVMLD
ncbi:barstar family protein [Kutzneria sp. NPDC052558]|uniref:barstar family protein n=1 Tax=Kutzneria sp. NPDC052558 TaxID=3364121 RepID=UPI0037C975E1